MIAMVQRPYSVLVLFVLALSLGACATVSEVPTGPPEDGPARSAPPDPPPAAGGQPGASGATAAPSAEPPPVQLTARAVELSPPETHSIRSGPGWLSAVVDLDANERADVCLLTVSAASFESSPRLSELSAATRLSQDGPDEVPEFFFEVYLNRPDGLVLFETKRIGRFPLLEGLEAVDLTAGGAPPAVVSARFQDQIGHKQVWLVAGRQGLTTFVLEQTPVIDSTVVDLDDDGIGDVLKAQSAFEQGRGYETFLTWYRWNGRTFAPHATANIVRNLNEFLRVLEEHLGAGRYERFLERAGRTAELPAAAAQLPRLLGRLFRPEADETTGGEAEPVPFARMLAEHEVADVAFPEFLENPFPSPGERTSITAPLRIDTAEGRTYYYRTSIVMARNPFEARQFSLAPPP